MEIDLDQSPAVPAPDRELAKVRSPDRQIRETGARSEYRGRGPRRSFEARVEHLVRDVGAFRTVALADLTKGCFDGHRFVAMKGIARAEREGWVKRQRVKGPKGGEYTVVVATAAGAERAAALWEAAGRKGQGVWSGAVKPAEVGHDVAVYRAAVAEQRRIEDAGGRVIRVRIDAELKGRVAAATERARQSAGREAADAARSRAASEEGLPMDGGRVLVPDAQVEYISAAGVGGRCNVEVASEHYAGGAIRAKAKAGFRMYAATSRAAAVVRRALARGRSKRGGFGADEREREVFEL